ncbi:MarR family transcriptional regulator, partial [Mycobacterium tuberculosis]|nr:MarR family transcriptional regulator [Mycobacterium tuberculosis]
NRPIGVAAALDPLTAVKLWQNPCWLSFRINFLALAFNNPVYGLIDAGAGIKRPEFVVLYSLYLKDGVAAKDVCVSSGFPKNAISRAIQVLLERDLVRRAEDAADRRSFSLRLTDAGCYRGPLDGRPGDALQRAIKSCPDQEPSLRIETGFHTSTLWRVDVDA